MFFKNAAEVSLIMISAYFTDLADGHRRFVKKELLCFVHPQIGQIFGRGGIVSLTEDLCQISRTVIHIVCNKVQIDVFAVISDNKIPKDGGNLCRCQGCGICIKNCSIIILCNLKFSFDLFQGFLKFVRVDWFQKIIRNF